MQNQILFKKYPKSIETRKAKCILFDNSKNTTCQHSAYKLISGRSDCRRSINVSVNEKGNIRRSINVSVNEKENVRRGVDEFVSKNRPIRTFRIEQIRLVVDIIQLIKAK